MTDFHTHILPGIDDGSKSVEESISMLKLEAQQGITEVFLTPHYYASENSPLEFLDNRSRAWKKLQPYLSDELPSVRLGSEVQYFEGITAVKDIGKLRIEGTNYLLLEMPFCTWSDRMIADVLELNDHSDIQIVLAHIERYMSWQYSNLWKELKAHGILMQSNVSFFANWKTKLRATRMLDKGEINFLGSDCHNMRNRHPNWDMLPQKAKNKFQTSEAYRLLLNNRLDG